MLVWLDIRSTSTRPISPAAMGILWYVAIQPVIDAHTRTETLSRMSSGVLILVRTCITALTQGPPVAVATFLRILKEEFPHLRPGSKRVCPVCERLGFCGTASSADDDTARIAARRQHLTHVNEERAFASKLRREAENQQGVR